MDSLCALMCALALFAFFSFLRQRRTRRAAILRTMDARREKRENTRGGVMGLSPSRELLTRLGNRLPASLSAGGERLLRESGAAWSPSYLQGLRLLTALALCAPLLPLAWTGVLFLPLVFAAGFQLPLLYLKRMRRRRWARLAEDLPEIADLVAVLCYSGESLHRALIHSPAACGHPATREELKPVLERMRIGESAVEALQRLSDHPCPEMRRFGRTVLRAEGSGGAVADILEELASELRSARRERNRVHASRVSVYILFPLVLLILPSFLLLTVGGMIIGHTT